VDFKLVESVLGTLDKTSGITSFSLFINTNCTITVKTMVSKVTPQCSADSGGKFAVEVFAYKSKQNSEDEYYEVDEHGAEATV
jgi:hypothetical protein